MPYPVKNEDRAEYIKRFMQSEEAKKSYPDVDQRLAVAFSLWRERHGGKKPDGEKKQDS